METFKNLVIAVLVIILLGGGIMLLDVQKRLDKIENGGTIGADDDLKVKVEALGKLVNLLRQQTGIKFQIVSENLCLSHDNVVLIMGLFAQQSGSYKAYYALKRNNEKLKKTIKDTLCSQ